MLVALTLRTEVRGIDAPISLEMLTSLKLVRLTKPKVIVISRLARSTMLSKILLRSGLSRLLWIKDAVSHRLYGCVLELYGLLVACLATCSLLNCLIGSLPRRFRSRLPRSNFSRVSRFRLLVNPLTFKLSGPLLDPCGRPSPLGADKQHKAGLNSAKSHSGWIGL